MRGILISEGAQEGRVAPTWGEVRVLGKHQVDLLWSHLARAPSLQDGYIAGRTIWPMWIGISPVQGVRVPLGKGEVNYTKVIMFWVLEAAHTIVGGGTAFARAPHACHSAAWVACGNQPRGCKGSHAQEDEGWATTPIKSMVAIVSRHSCPVRQRVGATSTHPEWSTSSDMEPRSAEEWEAT